MPKLLRILAECFNLQKSPSHFSLAIFSYKPKRAAVYKNTTTFSQPSFSTMYSCYLFPYEVFKYNLKFLFFITLPVILTYLLFSQILNLLLPAYGILKIGFLSTGCWVYIIDAKNTILIKVPDLEILTEGYGMANAIKMARDAIGLTGITNEDINIENAHINSAPIHFLL